MSETINQVVVHDIIRTNPSVTGKSAFFEFYIAACIRCRKYSHEDGDVIWTDKYLVAKDFC